MDLSTGQFIHTKTDMALPDTIPIAFTRTYITNDSRSRAFGIGSTDSYDLFLMGEGPLSNAYTYQELIQPDGGRVRFDRVSAGNGFTDTVYVATTAPGEFYGAVLSWSSGVSDLPLGACWVITLKDGTTLRPPRRRR